jgi:hypothetical protein
MGAVMLQKKPRHRRGLKTPFFPSGCKRFTGKDLSHGIFTASDAYLQILQFLISPENHG